MPSNQVNLSEKDPNTVQKFWNMAVIDDTTAEIQLYGEVKSKRPIDWWTGEPQPGQYITPEGFAEELEKIKDKAEIIVKINSCGGDYYTGLAIHNALKGLQGKKTVIVEGIAASAAATIAACGDAVKMYPGSMLMIHGCSVTVFNVLNLQTIEKLKRSVEAVNKSAAEVYAAKSGKTTKEIFKLMEDESWMIGQEAVDAGFANEVIEDDTGVEMLFSAQTDYLMVNGINHNIKGLHLPQRLNLSTLARQAAVDTKKMKGVIKKMDMKELKEQHPELAQQLAKEAATQALKEERTRIKEIDDISANISDKKMIEEAKYGEKRCNAQELAFRAMKENVIQGSAFLQAQQLDHQTTNQVPAVPPPTDPKQGKVEQEQKELKFLVDMAKNI